MKSLIFDSKLTLAHTIAEKLCVPDNADNGIDGFAARVSNVSHIVEDCLTQDGIYEVAETLAAKLEGLECAVNNVYRAALWTADRPCDSAKLWEALRDAAGLPPGQSPKPANPKSEWKLRDEYVIGGKRYHLLKIGEDFFEPGDMQRSCFRTKQLNGIDSSLHGDTVWFEAFRGIPTGQSLTELQVRNIIHSLRKNREATEHILCPNPTN